MTLDEAIYREEALAYSFGERYKRGGEPVGDLPGLEAEHKQYAEWLKELKAYREKPMYLWFPINRKLPNQYQHVIAILRSGAEVETYLAHEMWHIVDGVRVNFGDVVFWRYMEVNADE